MSITSLSHVFDPELDEDRLRDDPEVDEILRGTVDLHVHPAPSPYPRRISILDAAKDAAENGFRAIIVKSHHTSMQTDVLALQSAGLEELSVDVHSGVALNRTIGGLNPYAVELFLSLGAKVVWFPTISSGAHIEFHEVHHSSGFPVAQMPLRDHEPISVLDADGKLVPEAHEIIEIIRERDAILNAGHLPVQEIDVLVREAHAAGVTRIVVNHPTFIIGATPEKCAEWVRQGAMIEHCLALAVNRPASPLSHEALTPYLEACGVDATVFSSDLGQRNNILPVSAFRRMARRMLDNGWSGDDVHRMVADNPGRLLDGGSSS